MDNKMTKAQRQTLICLVANGDRARDVVLDARTAIGLAQSGLVELTNRHRNLAWAVPTAKGRALVTEQDLTEYAALCAAKA